MKPKKPIEELAFPISPIAMTKSSTSSAVPKPPRPTLPKPPQPMQAIAPIKPRISRTSPSTALPQMKVQLPKAESEESVEEGLFSALGKKIFPSSGAKPAPEAPKQAAPQPPPVQTPPPAPAPMPAPLQGKKIVQTPSFSGEKYKNSPSSDLIKNLQSIQGSEPEGRKVYKRPMDALAAGRDNPNAAPFRQATHALDYPRKREESRLRQLMDMLKEELDG